MSRDTRVPNFDNPDIDDFPEEEPEIQRVKIDDIQFDMADVEKYAAMSFDDKRTECIKQFKKTFKDQTAFDICMLSKEERSRMSEDKIYMNCTRAIRGLLFARQMDILTKVENQTFAMDARDQTKNILDAVDRKNKMIFDGLVDGDDENAININFNIPQLERSAYTEKTDCELFIGKNENGSIDTEDKTAEDIAKDRAMDKMKKDNEKLANSGN